MNWARGRLGLVAHSEQKNGAHNRNCTREGKEGEEWAENQKKLVLCKISKTHARENSGVRKFPRLAFPYSSLNFG